MTDILRDKLHKKLEDASGLRTTDKPDKPGSTGKPSRIVSPDDERGTPYPGDFDNPLDGTFKGCF